MTQTMQDWALSKYIDLFNMSSKVHFYFLSNYGTEIYADHSYKWISSYKGCKCNLFMLLCSTDL